MPPPAPTPDITARPDTPVERARISVVIPVKDDAVSLARCLAALAAQTRLPNEVIVVDNGSHDDSAAVARSHGAIVVPCAEPGIPAASSTGYDRATGEFILRLDADCVPGPRWIDAMAAAFARHPAAGAVTGAARFIDGPRVLRVPLAVAYLLGYAAAVSPALGHLPLFGSNLGLRRSAWRAVRAGVHRHDPRLHDDLDLSFHLGARYPIRYARAAPMGMSMRPFATGRNPLAAVGRGILTVVAHWPGDYPPLRWMRRADYLRTLRGRQPSPAPRLSP